jgi:hypothetical protein
MKKFFALVAFAGFMTACNNNSKEKETPAADTSTVGPATSAPDTTATTMAPVKDSLMQYKDGKVMIMTGGSWATLSATVTTTNGRKVNPNGDVSKGGKTRKMEEGMMIDKDGQMMDKEGKAMDNTGWE